MAATTEIGTTMFECTEPCTSPFARTSGVYDKLVLVAEIRIRPSGRDYWGVIEAIFASSRPLSQL